jgi:hypothetical protein
MLKTAVYISVITVFCLISTGCDLKSDNLNNISPYKEMIGLQYILKVDCYVSNFIKDSEKITPSLSPNMMGRNGGFPLPVSKKKIGYRRQGKEILDIIPKGTMFEIVNAVHLHGFETDIWDYEIRIIQNDKWNLVSAVWLTDIYSSPPKFLPELAEKVSRK